MFRKLFKRRNLNIIGMIHIEALPGTPKNRFTMKEIQNKAVKQAEIYKEHQVDGLIVENMHDIPYLHTDRVGPEITAAMSVICHQVKKVFTTGPVGVQILAGANKQALGAAQAAGIDFIRAEGFVFSHVADEGLMNACAGDLLRYRKQIGADNILVFTDIKKKHSSHAITSDISIGETARAAEFFLSDGVIITGSQTGQATDIMDLQDVQSSTGLPVLIGSGVTNENLEHYKSANGLIVGSHFKVDGHWNNELDQDRIEKFTRTVQSLRNQLQIK